MMDQAAEFRARLSELRQRGGKRWRTPGPLRAEIVAWARGLQSRGYGAEAIAREIVLSGSTLRRWLSAGEEDGGFRRVKLRALAGKRGSGGPVLVSPGAYRLEGLSLGEAIDAFRRL